MTEQHSITNYKSGNSSAVSISNGFYIALETMGQVLTQTHYFEPLSTWNYQNMFSVNVMNLLRNQRQWYVDCKKH